MNESDHECDHECEYECDHKCHPLCTMYLVRLTTTELLLTSRTGSVTTGLYQNYKSCHFNNENHCNQQLIMSHVPHHTVGNHNNIKHGSEQ